MRVISFLWIVPFICFLGGYQLIRLFADHSTIEAPSVVGHHIHDAIKLLSTYHLNARILTEKEEPDFPEGIIISQSPPQGQKIKSHQSLFLVVTRKPAKPQAPRLYGLIYKDALSLAQNGSLKLKAYTLESSNPQGTCIAQNAQPQEDLTDGTLTAYFSEGTTPIRLFPNLKGKKLSEVQRFLKSYGIQTKISHQHLVDESHICSSCVAVEQRPLPGTLVNLKKNFVVHLTVAPPIT